MNKEQIKIENKNQLPDVASDSTQLVAMGELEWVGMEEISVPVLLHDSEGASCRVPAKVSVYVNLIDPKAKGIHMSRLYKTIQEKFINENLSFKFLQTILNEFLLSHYGISTEAKIKINLEAPVLRLSLKSKMTSWRTYPFEWESKAFLSVDGLDFKNFFSVQVDYSSTCPASAALSRHLIANNLIEKFDSSRGAVNLDEVVQFLSTKEGIAATPHAQRSFAKIRVEVRDEFNPYHLIDSIERALGTPVQTIVKREDEQEFARLNAQNLMFCEDAARKIKNSLESMKQIGSYYAHISHLESLHPHNAVAVVRRGDVS